MKNIKRMQVRLPEKLHTWIRENAFKCGISMNTVIIKSLEKTKEKHERDAQKSPKA